MTAYVERGYNQQRALTIFNNVSPLPCSHPACSEFCVHLEFLPEIVCKVGKVCIVEKLRSTFHTFHDYLNFYGEKKMTGYLPFTIERVNREIKRRTKAIGAFPDGQSVLVLVCARLRHVAASNWGTKRYLNMNHLFDLELQCKADGQFTAS